MVDVPGHVGGASEHGVARQLRSTFCRARDGGITAITMRGTRFLLGNFVSACILCISIS